MTNTLQEKEQKEKKIITIAAFCFAIVSWRATAGGMQEYVFASSVEAGLISFAIQSILFVFNLRLPNLIEKLGDLTSVEKREKTRNGKRYKWTWVQKTAAIFYALILFSSSFFSFVYICNTVVYEHDAGYSDDNVILKNEYQLRLKEAKQAIEESLNVLPVIASEQLGEMQIELKKTGRTENEKSLEELKQEYIEAEKQKNICDAELEKAANELEAAKERYDSLKDVMYWKDDEFGEAERKYDKAVDKYNVASDEKVQAENAYTNAKTAVDNYEPSVQNLVSSILAEILSGDMGMKEIQENIDILSDYVMELGNENTVPENYAELVRKMKSLNLTISQYWKLQGDSEEEGAWEMISRLEQKLQQEIAIPDPQNRDSFSETKRVWEETWKERYAELQKLIWMIPDYTEEQLSVTEDSAVNIEHLRNYDAEEAITETEDLVREKLTDINVIEKTCLLLTGKYRLTAIISLVIAFGLDLSSLFAGMILYWMEKCEKK